MPSRNFSAQLFAEHFGDSANVLQPAAGDLADRLEVEAVLDARFPIAVLLAFFVGVGDLADAVALAAELDDPVHEPADAEIVEVDRVGEELSVFGSGAALGD